MLHEITIKFFVAGDDPVTELFSALDDLANDQIEYVGNGYTFRERPDLTGTPSDAANAEMDAWYEATYGPDYRTKGIGEKLLDA